MKKTLKIIKRASLSIGVLIFVYMVGLVAAEGLADAYSEEIKGKEDLYKALSEEKARLEKCQDYEIRIKLIDESDLPYAKRICKDTYEIGVYETTNRSTIKHELYHIEKGHTDVKAPEDITEEIQWYTTYFFYEEPQAAIYELTDIRL